MKPAFSTTWTTLLLAVFFISPGRSSSLAPQISGGSGCPTATQCRCALQNPTQNEAPNPPSCYDHTDAAYVAGTAFHGCCRFDATCNSVVPCKFKIAIIATAKAGQTCDFTIQSGGNTVATCTGQSSCAYSSVSEEQLKCGTSSTFTVKVSGTVVFTSTATCSDC